MQKKNCKKEFYLVIASLKFTDKFKQFGLSKKKKNILISNLPNPKILDSFKSESESFFN